MHTEKTFRTLRLATRLVILTLGGLLAGLPSYGQVLIAPTPGTPHASSMLEVKSTNKALLIPRLTLANRPAGTNGLMYYQTDNTPGFYYFNNGSWKLNNFDAMDYWLLNSDDNTLYPTNRKVAVGIDSTDGNGLFVRHYTSGKAAVVGSDASGSLIYAQGMLGVLAPSGLGIPYDVFNAAVLGIKPNNGATGAAIYGWNNDDNSENFAGLFYADGPGAAGETNYGVYAVADSSAGENYAGYFRGRVSITGHEGSSAADSANTLVNVRVAHGANIDTRGINVISHPADGWGIGVFSEAGYRGIYGFANSGSYTGITYGVLGQASGDAGTRYGVYGSSNATGTNAYGVNGLANGAATYNYGVKGEALNSTNTNYGVFGNAHGTSATNYGVYALANSGTDNYGVYTIVNGAATNNYGVYSSVSGASGSNWAGYFLGAVYGSRSLSIGTTLSDLADIHVVGQGSLGKILVAPNNTVNDSAMIILAEDREADFSMGLLYDGSQNKLRVFTDGALVTPDYNHLIIQRDGGEIAINTETFASGYQVSINGKVICTEVRVAALGSWPDYVFRDDYELMPLDELESSIAENGHLPNVPAASVIESEGMELGQMNKVLMEKVEELTLYIIQLNKQLEAQADRIDQLESSNH